MPVIGPALPEPDAYTQDRCAANVPWWCAGGWVPILGAPIALSTRCREAYDLEKACRAGIYKEPLPGPGAGPAPAGATSTDPRVYNDPALLEQQRQSDWANWQEWLEAQRQWMSAPKPEEETNWLPWLLAAAAVLVVVVRR